MRSDFKEIASAESFPKDKNRRLFQCWLMANLIGENHSQALISVHFFVGLSSLGLAP